MAAKEGTEQHSDKPSKTSTREVVKDDNKAQRHKQPNHIHKRGENRWRLIPKKHMAQDNREQACDNTPQATEQAAEGAQ